MKVWQLLVLSLIVGGWDVAQPTQAAPAPHDAFAINGPVDYVVNKALDNATEKAGTNWPEVQKWTGKLGVLFGTRDALKAETPKASPITLVAAGGCANGVCSIPNAVQSGTCKAGDNCTCDDCNGGQACNGGQCAAQPAGACASGACAAHGGPVRRVAGRARGIVRGAVSLPRRIVGRVFCRRCR